MERKNPTKKKTRPTPQARRRRSGDGQLVRKDGILVYTGPTAGLSSAEAIDQVRDERAGGAR